MTKYSGLVIRDEDQAIDHIDLIKRNRGKQRISGLDVGVRVADANRPRQPGPAPERHPDPALAAADRRWRPLRQQPRPLPQRRRGATLAPYRERGLGTRALLGHAVQQLPLSGYRDQEVVGKANRNVEAYSLWNLSAGWEATKSLSLRVGVQNLLDKSPPFSQQAYFFLSGYDPSYTDTRGRYGYASLRYTFR